MSNLYAILAFDNLYGGMNSIYDTAIVEANNKEEAEDYAIDLSHEVINSYPMIHDHFELEAEDYDIQRDTDEWYDFINECIENDVAYEIYKVKENTESLEELDSEFAIDPDGFIEEYCEKEE